jgi:probable HAF family extracellular repeat protein
VDIRKPLTGRWVIGSWGRWDSRFKYWASSFLVCASIGAYASKLNAPTTPRPNDPVTYSLVVLGEMPRASADAFPGLNGKGEASFWKETPQASLRPMIWRQGKGEEGTLPAGQQSGVLCGINDKGQAVGWTSSSAALDDSGAKIRAVVYEKGKPRLLTTLGGEDGQAFAIGNDGQIVGTSAGKDGKRHAFVEAAGKITDLGVLPDGGFSVAYGVNAKGEIVGGAEQGGKQWAVIWRKGKIEKLAQTEDAVGSQARGINDRGEIVGYVRTDENETHAFYYAQGKMQDIGTLGDEPSTANSINNAGIVVGASNNTGKRKRAFVWHNGKMTDLNTRLDADYGILLQEGCRINDAGQILCIARNNQRSIVLVLLTPKL